MASTLNSAPVANSSSSNVANPAQNSGRPSLRSSASTKGDGRRQSGSPVDGGQRRTNSHKAWTQGTNPITQRSSYSSSNGNMAQRQSGPPRPGQKESNTPDHHAHDRLVFLFASFIGLHAVITTKSGEKFSGIFSSSTLETSDSSFLLKMVQRASQENQPKTNGVSDVGSPYLGTAPEHIIAFDVKDVTDIAVPNVSPAEVSVKESNGTAGFRTDSDISGNLAMRERTLQRWEPENDVDLALESSTGDTKGWDQFEANERLFGAKTNYDENLYTTRIDRSDPSYRQKQVEAARIAREIEGSDVDNPHMREERGLVAPDTGDQDEEDKYSGVRRENKAFPPLVSGQSNKYTPPARRQAAAPPATTGKQPSAAPTPTVSQPPAKEATPAENPQTTASSNDSTEVEQKTAAGTAAAAPISKRPGPDNATANVETEVLDHFRQFANSEKLKMQERRRNQASYDRTIKLNELMKFSKNFKLSTPVPKDLVPILAKDPHKQEAIIQRAHSNDDKPPGKNTPPAPEQKGAPRPTGPAGVVPPVAPSDRQNYSRGRQGYLPTGPLAGPNGRFPQQPMQPGRPGTGMLGHRLTDNLQQRKGAGMGPIPAPLPIQDARGPPTGPVSEQPRVTSPVKAQTPASAAASKFNVRAMEFKPNPAASTFTPGGASATAASPRSFSRNRSVSRATTPSAFFGNRKPQPIAERPSIDDQFNPIKRMKKEGAEATDKPYSFNGGIPPPYKTLPTWDAPAGNEEKTYDQMFKQPGGVPSVLPQGRSASNNPHLPQQHQVPFQVQQGNTGMPSSTGPPNGPHLHQGPHGPAHSHVDDHHRMQFSASSPHVFPSPRLQQTHIGYPSPMAPHAQLAFGQPMPQFYGGPQPGPMRPYQAGPQFMNPQAAMGAPMMVQQPSNGPYMSVAQGISPYTPQMQMYSPSPGHVYPQNGPPPQPHSGYPSPSRGAPMMMHQNSQSGQPPQPMMFMTPGQPAQAGYVAQQPGHMPHGRGGYPQQQPHFSSSPHQVHHFPPNQHRAPSNSYNQVPQAPPQMQNNAPANTGANSHAAEATDEAK
ncbi:SM domain found in ataxin-2 [Penicillium hispanicum]|uniref:SM domain found in ataxin-2 n=1 Tax=Penicillium hispanicum TaxID=1080232 RepID=UPI00253F9973|nr:SM domain found in ataxin-2 [Penicillium hispanicum]KAJ5587814.1 SM domain found in ataxin-2 [Penicillium hispanicum]